MRQVKEVGFFLALFVLVVASPKSSMSLYRSTGFMEEFANPCSLEVRNWLSRILEIKQTLVDFQQPGGLKIKGFYEQKDGLRAKLHLLIVERLTWYHPKARARISADKEITECADLLVKLEFIFSKSSAEVPEISVEQPKLSLSEKEEVLRQRSKLERMRISLLRSIYDTKWRKKFVVLIDEYLLKQDRIRQELRYSNLPYSHECIRLRALLITVNGLTNWLKPESPESIRETKIQKAILVGMEYSVLQIRQDLGLQRIVRNETFSKELYKLVEDSEHLAAKFLYLKFPPGQLSKKIAVEIRQIFVILRKINFYNFASSDQKLCAWKTYKIEPTEQDLQVLFARGTMAKLTILILKNVEHSLVDAPQFRRERIIAKWKANSQALMMEYEAWGLKSSSYSPRAYQLFEKITSMK